MKNKQYFFAVVIVILTVFTVLFPAEVSFAVKKSVDNCLCVVIPSLFGLMALCILLQNSGICAFFGTLLSPIGKYVFGMDETVFPIFLFSLFAGYPVGAKMLVEAVKSKKISADYASRILPCCYCISPNFAVGLAGASLFGSPRAGFVIYLSCVLTNIILALVIPRLSKSEHCKGICTYSIIFSSEMITTAVESTAKAIFSICSMILFFSLISAAVIASGAAEFLSKKMNVSPQIIMSVLDITAVAESARLDYSKIPLVCAAFSFGGICILMQVSSISRNIIKLTHLIIVRLLSIPLSYFTSLFLIRLLMGAEPALSGHFAPIGVRHITPIPSLFLLIMTIILLSQKNIAKTEKM